MSTWQKSFMVIPLAVLGAALGLASLFGAWSTVVLHDGTTAPAWTLFTQKLFGLSYTLALTAMLAMVAVAVAGRHRGASGCLRGAGLALAVLSLALLAVTACVVGMYPYRVEGSSFDSSLHLGWGIHAAFGAWAALGAALYFAPSSPPTEDSRG